MSDVNYSFRILLRRKREYFICQHCKIFTQFYSISLKILALSSSIHIYLKIFVYDIAIAKFPNEHLLFLESEETTPLSFGLCRGWQSMSPRCACT